MRADIHRPPGWGSPEHREQLRTYGAVFARLPAAGLDAYTDAVLAGMPDEAARVVSRSVAEATKRPPCPPAARAAGDAHHLELHGPIGGVEATSVQAPDVLASLRDMRGAASVRVSINSPGGEVFGGIAIYNGLRALAAAGARIEVTVIGVAASIASVIAMAGDRIEIAEGAFVMVHNAWTLGAGNAEDLRVAAAMLDKIDSGIVATYVGRTGRREDEIRALMQADTIMTADEAVAAGFADAVYRGGSAAKARAALRSTMTAIEARDKGSPVLAALRRRGVT